MSLILDIVGNDDENHSAKILKVIEKYGLKKRVFFRGALYGESKITMLKKAYVMVLPSLSENFANVVLESFICGCPVILTKDVGAVEIVKRHQLGLITNGTSSDIADKILYLSQYPDIRNAFANSATKHMRQYAWSNNAATFSQVYQSLIHYGYQEKK